MGRPRLEKPGDKFGEWTLIKPGVKSGYWVCQCSCGTIKEVRKDGLVSGKTKSCGCITKMLQSISHKKRGLEHDLTGQKFNKWTVVEYAGNGRWLCECECGKRGLQETGALRKGKAKGCIKCTERHVNIDAITTHGESHTKLYGTYRSMCDRCNNPHHRAYHRYGGRGIRICDEWQGENGYERYAQWAKQHGYKEGLQIDRIDNDGNYSPDNCRWVTAKTNSNNKSNNRRLTINGETKTICEWADHFGISKYVFYGRIVKLGWSLEDTLNTPVGARRKRHDDSKTESLAETK